MQWACEMIWVHGIFSMNKELEIQDKKFKDACIFEYLSNIWLNFQIILMPRIKISYRF